MKILMVCLGNICRSPLAEGILRSKIETKGLDWEVDSAGTGAWHIGNSPDRRSQMVANEYGIDIQNQRARQFTKNDFDDFEKQVLLPHKMSNYGPSLAKNQEQRQKVVRILKIANGSNKDVPDPYYNDDGFELVYHLLNEACENLIEQLNHSSSK